MNFRAKNVTSEATYVRLTPPPGENIKIQNLMIPPGEGVISDLSSFVIFENVELASLARIRNSNIRWISNCWLEQHDDHGAHAVSASDG